MEPFLEPAPKPFEQTIENAPETCCEGVEVTFAKIFEGFLTDPDA
jgi:hypothetical protein